MSLGSPEKIDGPFIRLLITTLSQHSSALSWNVLIFSDDASCALFLSETRGSELIGRCSHLLTQLEWPAPPVPSLPDRSSDFIQCGGLREEQEETEFRRVSDPQAEKRAHSNLPEVQFHMTPLRWKTPRRGNGECLVTGHVLMGLLIRLEVLC